MVSHFDVRVLVSDSCYNMIMNIWQPFVSPRPGAPLHLHVGPLNMNRNRRDPRAPQSLPRPINSVMLDIPKMNQLPFGCPHTLGHIHTFIHTRGPCRRTGSLSVAKKKKKKKAQRCESGVSTASTTVCVCVCVCQACQQIVFVIKSIDNKPHLFGMHC